MVKTAIIVLKILKLGMVASPLSRPFYLFLSAKSKLCPIFGIILYCILDKTASQGLFPHAEKEAKIKK